MQEKEVHAAGSGKLASSKVSVIIFHLFAKYSPNLSARSVSIFQLKPYFMSTFILVVEKFIS